MKKYVYVMICVALMGCASNTPIVYNTYGDENYTIEKIGILKGVGVKGKFLDFTSISFPSYARILDNQVGASIELGNGVLGRSPNEVRVLPGRYVFQIYCDDGNKYQYLKEAIEIKAGYTTTMKCEWKSGGAWIKEGTYKLIIETYKTTQL